MGDFENIAHDMGIHIGPTRIMEWICFFSRHMSHGVQLFNRLAMFTVDGVSGEDICGEVRCQNGVNGLFCWQQMDHWHLPVSLFDRWQIRILGL